MIKGMLRLGITLLIISGIAAAALGAIYAVTKPEIEKQQKLAKEQAQKEVLPAAKSFEEKKIDENLSYLIGKDETGKVVGYIFTSEGRGYSSQVVSIVGVNPDGEIQGIKVISQAETPGLGALVTEPKFLDGFKKAKAAQVKVVPDGGSIKPITGATITPRAICTSVSSLWSLIQKDIGQGTTKQVKGSPCDECPGNCYSSDKVRTEKPPRDAKLI